MQLLHPSSATHWQRSCGGNNKNHKYRYNITRCIPKQSCSLLGINAYRTLLSLAETSILSTSGSISDIAVIAKANVVLSPTMAVLAGFSTITIHTLFHKFTVSPKQIISDLTVLAFFGGLLLSALAISIGISNNAGSTYMLSRSIASIPIVAVTNVYIGKLLFKHNANIVWHEMVKAIGIHIAWLYIAYTSTGTVDATAAGVASILSDAFLLCRLFVVSQSQFPSSMPSIDLCMTIRKAAGMVTLNTMLFSGSQAVISKAVASLGVIEIAAHQLGSLINSLLTLTGDVYSMWACVTVPNSKSKQSDITRVLSLAHITGIAVFLGAFVLIYNVLPIFVPVEIAFILRNQTLPIALICSINTILKVYAGILTALTSFDKLLSANLVCVSSLCLGIAALDGMAVGHDALQGIWVLWLAVCVLRYIYYLHAVLHHFF